jgi:ketosteroid isomerase-like protein
LVTAVLGRVRDPQSDHDLDAFVACFQPDYRSEQPVHPDRAFVGSEQARSNWAEIFAGVPDFQAELLRSADQGDTGWAEWHWHGTRTDGTRLDMRGVTIFGFRQDRIDWAGCIWRTLKVARGSTRPCTTWPAASSRRPSPVEFTHDLCSEFRYALLRQDSRP